MYKFVSLKFDPRCSSKFRPYNVYSGFIGKGGMTRAMLEESVNCCPCTQIGTSLNPLRCCCTCWNIEWPGFDPGICTGGGGFQFTGARTMKPTNSFPCLELTPSNPSQTEYLCAWSDSSVTMIDYTGAVLYERLWIASDGYVRSEFWLEVALGSCGPYADIGLIYRMEPGSTFTCTSGGTLVLSEVDDPNGCGATFPESLTVTPAENCDRAIDPDNWPAILRLDFSDNPLPPDPAADAYPGDSNVEVDGSHNILAANLPFFDSGSTFVSYSSGYSSYQIGSPTPLYSSKWTITGEFGWSCATGWYFTGSVTFDAPGSGINQGTLGHAFASFGGPLVNGGTYSGALSSTGTIPPGTPNPVTVRISW